MSAPQFGLSASGSNPKFTSRNTLELAVQAVVDRLQESIDNTALAVGIGSGTVYTSAADGIAGTSDGEVFLATVSNQLVAYLNDEGSESELAKLPTQTSVDSLLQALARKFDTPDGLFQNTSLGYGGGIFGVSEGDFIEYGRFRAKVAASDAQPISDDAVNGYHKITAGGVKLRVVPDVTGYSVPAFGGYTAAAVNAAIAASELDGGTRGSVDVWVPNGNYVLEATTVSIPIGVGFVAASGALFTYNGTGAAIEAFGDGQTGTRRMVLPNIERDQNTGTDQPDWDAGTDSTSVGVQLNALHYEQVHLRAIRGFYIGLELKALDKTPSGNSQNMVCNTIHLGQIINNQRGIAFTYNATGGVQGVNQNTLIGGVIRIDAAWDTEPDRYGFYMPDQENNGNTFIGTNLEDFSGSADAEIAIYCNSTNNVFLNTRFENGGAGSIEFGPQGVNNTLICSLDDPTVDGPFEDIVNDNGFGNKYITNDVIASRKFKLDFNTGQILFGNGNDVASYPLRAYGSDGIWLGDSLHKRARYYGSVRQESYEVTSGNFWDRDQDFVILNNATGENILGSAAGRTDVNGLVTVIDVNGNCTLKHASSPSSGDIVTKSAADIAMVAMQPVQFMLYNGIYYQV
ncbi:hypothetical protein SAMN04490244_101256 [Tranquillimonas rosea]|uniref:Uncharacterized protein n=1 Tax=Tranquillimonas rosea TaxID=641238 RepID=A0A1H9PMZ1_9RHOB|nr:hypothetical protein [Tranquillimonas rosea]SER49450.1 hypothetical protein SAMN04490244_101256 [Tranquillimonas rosea]